MDLRKLKTLIDLVSESNISELEITEAEGKVHQRHSFGSGPPAGGGGPVICGGTVNSFDLLAQLLEFAAFGRQRTRIVSQGAVASAAGFGLHELAGSNQDPA